VNSPFVSVSDLAAQLAGDSAPVVLDASLVLHAAQVDGDYRSDSGYPGWLNGHIPGSRHVDLATQFSDPAAEVHFAYPKPQAIADELARLGITEHSHVVVYDSAATMWAARLWYLLRWIGVEVRVLDGGLAGWRSAGLPLDSGKISSAEEQLGQAYRSVAPWTARPRRNAWVDIDELLGRSLTDDRPLVCALGGDAFAGARPTRYTRRGRIPGSLNVPSRALFTADGTVETRAHLERVYTHAGVGVGANAPEVLLYCGGGISAASNALTLAEIGVMNVRIYDGSLEEWSARPHLPLTVE
jgi:thiosulfate/3-mercaptopyruvate sulfurtransferase